MKFIVDDIKKLNRNIDDIITYKQSIENWDIRTFATEEQFNKACSEFDGRWRDKGKNHQSFKFADGQLGIKRQLNNIEVYVLEIDNFDELLKNYHNLLIECPDYDRHGKDALPRLSINITEY